MRLESAAERQRRQLAEKTRAGWDLSNYVRESCRQWWSNRQLTKCDGECPFYKAIQAGDRQMISEAALKDAQQNCRRRKVSCPIK